MANLSHLKTPFLSLKDEDPNIRPCYCQPQDFIINRELMTAIDPYLIISAVFIFSFEKLGDAL